MRLSSSSSRQGRYRTRDWSLLKITKRTERTTLGNRLPRSSFTKPSWRKDSWAGLDKTLTRVSESVSKPNFWKRSFCWSRKTRNCMPSLAKFSSYFWVLRTTKIIKINTKCLKFKTTHKYPDLLICSRLSSVNYFRSLLIRRLLPLKKRAIRISLWES